MVRFSDANSKIEQLKNVKELTEKYFNEVRNKVYSFDLLSGWSCPFAHECMSRAIEVTKPDGTIGRKIQDGSHTKFRCFSASQEVQYTNVYNLRKSNFDYLRQISHDIGHTRNHILGQAPRDMAICRIHVAGDFFNRAYFHAWIRIAYALPEVLFYAYTKSLEYWTMADAIPDNLVLTASRGGKRDDLIDQYKLREAVVVFSEEQAAELGLEIDHDDSHAANPAKRNQNFALLIHGTQPAGSEAASAIKELKRKNVKFSYSR